MQNKPSNIIMIGMPGSGKSTIGTLLAEFTSMDFVDTDTLIRNSSGRTLQEIIDDEGPLALRRIEEEVLLSLRCRNSVVATGGSAVYSRTAMEHLKADGLIIFLDVDLDTLKSRISNYETRGLAKQPEQTFEDLFRERLDLYRRYADLTIACGDLSREEVCSAIVTALKRKGTHLFRQ